MELSWCRILSVGNHVVRMSVNLGSHRDVCVCVSQLAVTSGVHTLPLPTIFVHCCLRISAMADMQLWIQAVP